MALRVLFIAPSAYLLGGVQDWLYMTCIGLRERGHRVVVGLPKGKFHIPVLYNQKYGGLETISFENRTRTKEGRIRCLATFLLNNRCDVIVGVNIGDLYEAYIRVAEELGDTRIVLTLHAIEMNYFLDIRAYAPILDGVITTNRLTEKMVREMGKLEDEDIYYAAYGIRRNEKMKKNSYYDLEKVNIAWVGRIEQKQKRVMDLIDIIKHLDKSGISYMLSIVGDGPDRQELMRGLKTANANKSVCLLGQMEKDGLSSFYEKNNILLITSEWETGPIIAWEAMEAGLVVVSTRYLGSKLEEALIDRRTALLYDVGDTYKASEEIIYGCKQEVRQEIIKNGYELVDQRYSEKISVRKWEEALFAIVNKKKKRVCREKGLKMAEGRYSGKLEQILGVNMSEKLRYVLRGKQANDAGSEWPHSSHEVNDQTCLWKYAEEIENGLQGDWSDNL